MASRLDELGRATADAARSMAKRQAEATERYADLLTRFGRGDLPVDRYVGEAAGLAVEESLKSAGAFLSAGGKWARQAADIVGGKPAKEAEATVRAAARTVARQAKTVRDA